MGEERFRSSEHEETIGCDDLPESRKKIFFKILLKVNRHISAEHEIENTEAREIVLEVPFFECHHRSNLRLQCPSISERGVKEVVFPIVWEATGDFELAVAPSRCQKKRSWRNVEACDFEGRDVYTV